MSRTWFWTRRVGDERTSHLAEFAAFHGAFTVRQRREPGLFARTFPVAIGVHRGRAVEIGFGTDGFNTHRHASATHTVITVPQVAGLPPGLRVFPSMRGGLTVKGPRGGSATDWWTRAGRQHRMETWLADVGYVSLSEALGLCVHVDGVSIPPPELVAWLDRLVDLNEAIEAA